MEPLYLPQGWPSSPGGSHAEVHQICKSVHFFFLLLFCFDIESCSLAGPLIPYSSASTSYVLGLQAYVTACWRIAFPKLISSHYEYVVGLFFYEFPGYSSRDNGILYWAMPVPGGQKQ